MFVNDEMEREMIDSNVTVVRRESRQRVAAESLNGGVCRATVNCRARLVSCSALLLTCQGDVCTVG